VCRLNGLHSIIAAKMTYKECKIILLYYCPYTCIRVNISAKLWAGLLVIGTKRQNDFQVLIGQYRVYSGLWPI